MRWAADGLIWMRAAGKTNCRANGGGFWALTGELSGIWAQLSQAGEKREKSGGLFAWRRSGGLASGAFPGGLFGQALQHLFNARLGFVFLLIDLQPGSGDGEPFVLAMFVDAGFVVVVHRFAALVEGVLIGGAIALETGEGFVLSVVPFERVGLFGEELGFDVGERANGALIEPVGGDELVDEMGGGIVLRPVGIEPGGFEGVEVFFVFRREDECVERAAAVTGGVSRGDFLTSRATRAGGREIGVHGLSVGGGCSGRWGGLGVSG